VELTPHQLMRSSVFGLPECIAGNTTGMVVVPGPNWALESVTAASVYPSCRQVGGWMGRCGHQLELATHPLDDPGQKHMGVIVLSLYDVDQAKCTATWRD
jgi:hypothetical protein